MLPSWNCGGSCGILNSAVGCFGGWHADGRMWWGVGGYWPCVGVSLWGASAHEAGGLRGTNQFWGFSWLPGPVCLGFLWGTLAQGWCLLGLLVMFSCWPFFFFSGGRVPNWGFSIVLYGVFLEILCFHVWSIRVIHGMISFFSIWFWLNRLQYYLANVFKHHKHINVGYWNVHGLVENVNNMAFNKLSDIDFVRVIKRMDLFCLSET